MATVYFQVNNHEHMVRRDTRARYTAAAVLTSRNRKQTTAAAAAAAAVCRQTLTNKLKDNISSDHKRRCITLNAGGG